MQRETDVYVRAVMLLALAVRNSSTGVDFVGLATPIVEAAQGPDTGSLQSLAGSIAVLAGAIKASRSDSIDCDALAGLAESLTQVHSESTRARALLAIISENC